MRPYSLLLVTFIFVAPCISQIAQKEPTLTVMAKDGRFVVSAMVGKDSPQIEVIKDRVKQDLPTSTPVEIKTDSSIGPFTDGWEASLHESLLEVRKWRNGIYVFRNDNEKERRRAKSQILESRYTPLGQTSDRLLVSRQKNATLVVLFATWCTPCRPEFEVLNDLHIRFADQGLEVIGLNIDEEREANIRSYAETLQVQFELGKVSGEVQHNIVRFTKFGAIPQALLFVNGRITAVFTGASPATLRLLKTEIEKVFNKSE